MSSIYPKDPCTLHCVPEVGTLKTLLFEGPNPSNTKHYGAPRMASQSMKYRDGSLLLHQAQVRPSVTLAPVSCAPRAHRARFRGVTVGRESDESEDGPSQRVPGPSTVHTCLS